WFHNGDASVTIAGYEPQSMTLHVEAQAPAVVATSVPAWKGWRILMDGVPVEILTYNHAFLAVEVRTGRHVVELRYLPTSFGAGLIVTMATLAAVALVVRQARRRGALARASSMPSSRP